MSTIHPSAVAVYDAARDVGVVTRRTIYRDESGRITHADEVRMDRDAILRDLPAAILAGGPVTDELSHIQLMDAAAQLSRVLAKDEPDPKRAARLQEFADACASWVPEEKS